MTYGAMYDEIWFDDEDVADIDYYGPEWVDCLCKEHNTFHENCDVLCACNGDD